MVSSATASERGPDGGRRLYVHDDSLRYLVGAGAPADAVIMALASARAMRVASHFLDTACEIRLVQPETAQATLASLGDALYAPITQVLAQIWRLPGNILSSRTRPLLAPLLSPRDRVVASCFASGYWTFATSIEAGWRMYADDDSFGVALSSSAIDKAMADLTIVRGRQISWGDSPVIPQKKALREEIPVTEWRRRHNAAAGEVSFLVQRLIEEQLRATGEEAGTLAVDVSRCVARLWLPVLGASSSASVQIRS